MIRRLLPLLALLPACGGDPAVPIAESRAPIVGGVAAPGEAAAVALVARRIACDEREPMLLCSGALVAPDLVLTAAHCLAAFGEAGQYEVFFGAALPPLGEGRFVRVARAWSHPAYEAESHAFDVALLRLARGVEVPPYELHAAVPQPGAAARAVGFGETRDPALPAGVRRHGETTVVAVDEASFRAAPGPAMSCTGDSGGPVLIDGALAGITVSGDVACAAEAIAVRVDAILDDFLHPALEEAPASEPDATLALDALCTAACTSDADCPAGLACVEDATGDGRCMLLALQEGSFGAPCSGDASCGDGGRCARLASDGPDACRCFTPCTPPPLPEAPLPPREMDAAGCAAGAGPAGALPFALLCSAIPRRRDRR